MKLQVRPGSGRRASVSESACRRGGLWALLATLLVACGPRGPAVGPPPPPGPLDAVELELRIKAAVAGGSLSAVAGADEPELPVGARLEVCFSASRSGHVSLWSRDAEGNSPVRIYPNEYVAATADQPGQSIEGGQEMCIGHGEQGYQLVVQPPLGKAAIYLHYVGERTYGSRWLRYRVVPAMVPASPTR